MDSLDEEEHGHLPYLVLLLHYLEIWKTAHEGKPPVAYREKSEFRDMVRRGARTNNAEGGEENFDEAVGAVLKTVNPHAPSSAVKEVFDARECDELEPDVSGDFSTRRFVCMKLADRISPKDAQLLVHSPCRSLVLPNSRRPSPRRWPTRHESQIRRLHPPPKHLQA